MRWRVPTFIGIGAQRSGTTWVADVLRTHPDVWLGRKELHFFDHQDPTGGFGRAPVQARALRPWDRPRYYAKFWSHRRIAAVGEFTPAYAALPDEGIRSISRCVPHAKLIYVLRDPVERSWSQTRKIFVDKHGGDLGNVSMADLEHVALSPFVDCRSDYAASIRRWFDHFPRDRFFFGLTSDIESEPRRFCRELFAFLGVDSDHDVGEILHQRRNERPPLDMPPAIAERLAERYAFQADEVRALTGLSPSWTAR